MKPSNFAHKFSWVVREENASVSGMFALAMPSFATNLSRRSTRIAASMLLDSAFGIPLLAKSVYAVVSNVATFNRFDADMVQNGRAQNDSPTPI